MPSKSVKFPYCEPILGTCSHNVLLLPELCPAYGCNNIFIHSAPPKKSTKQRIVAKYNYKANSNSPLGHELDVVQGQKLFYIETHQDNEHWWLAQNDNGDMGYVPADYMMVNSSYSTPEFVSLFRHNLTMMLIPFIRFSRTTVVNCHGLRISPRLYPLVEALHLVFPQKVRDSRPVARLHHALLMLCHFEPSFLYSSL